MKDNSIAKGPKQLGRAGGGKRKNRSSRRALRHQEALERQAAYDLRSSQEHYDLLVARGHGHCAEAIALKSRLGL